jgi:hypothetical protein
MSLKRMCELYKIFQILYNTFLFITSHLCSVIFLMSFFEKKSVAVLNENMKTNIKNHKKTKHSDDVAKLHHSANNHCKAHHSIIS